MTRNTTTSGSDTVGAIALLFVGAVIMFSLLAFFFPSIIGGFFQQQEAAVDSTEDVYSWETAKDNYEWFRTQEQDIKAQREQIENFEDQHKQFHETYGNDSSEWSRTTKNRHSRVVDRVTGAKNAHENMVAEYNARANQAHRAMFQCGLPYEMDEKFWLGDGRPDDKYEDGAPEQAPDDPAECSSLKNATDYQEGQ